MTLASAATPTFFLPFTMLDSLGNTKYFVSGENVAASPAMFAYLDARDQHGVDPKTIRVTSIGNTDSLPDRIDANVGLLDWAARLLTLNAPVKQHTMDYMMHYFLRDADGTSRFHKF